MIRFGYIVTAEGRRQTAPTIDPITWAHPVPAFSRARAIAEETGQVGIDIVKVPDGWTPACTECLVPEGEPHKCPNGYGVVGELSCAWIPTERVRT